MPLSGDRSLPRLHPPPQIIQVNLEYSYKLIYDCIPHSRRLLRVNKERKIRTFRAIEIALFHAPGALPSPK
jgi:hypothetical protein